MEKHRTIGERYKPAMGIVDQAGADRYFEVLVQETMSVGNTRAEAEEIERSNLAYFAGYCSDEVRERVERLFNCKHPIFGKVSENGPPTMEHAGLQRRRRS